MGVYIRRFYDCLVVRRVALDQANKKAEEETEKVAKASQNTTEGA